MVDFTVMFHDGSILAGIAEHAEVIRLTRWFTSNDDDADIGDDGIVITYHRNPDTTATRLMALRHEMIRAIY